MPLHILGQIIQPPDANVSGAPAASTALLAATKAKGLKRCSAQGAQCARTYLLPYRSTVPFLTRSATRTRSSAQIAVKLACSAGACSRAQTAPSTNNCAPPVERATLLYRLETRVHRRLIVRTGHLSRHRRARRNSTARHLLKNSSARKGTFAPVALCAP